MWDQPSQSESFIKAQKAEARALRKSRWWQTLITQAQCYYCAQNLDKEEVTMDHVVPIAQGGRSNKGNVVPCCKSCNTEKKYMTAVEWTLELEKKKFRDMLK